MSETGGRESGESYSRCWRAGGPPWGQRAGDGQRAYLELGEAFSPLPSLLLPAGLRTPGWVLGR